MSSDLQLNRSLASRLPASSTRRVVIITGARQTGKTTLSRRCYDHLRYVNLDAPENRETLANLPTMAWSRAVGNAVIDEAQKEPTVFEKVKYAFDEGGVSFTVLTGSSQILLLKKIRESLAGRAFFYELWPLMQCELHQAVSGEPEPLLERLFSASTVGEVLSQVPPVLLEDEDFACRQAEDHLLAWGGMPALLGLEAQERWQWLKNYGYTYLERDLTDLARLDDLMPFRKFQKLSALRSAGLLNFSELARDCGISVDTARRYMEYLNLSYQAVLLPPYYRNLTSSLVKTPKLYWTDVGIWRQLTGFKGERTGQIHETMVVAEIIKWMRTAGRDAGLYFYRTRSGMEIDLLLELPAGLVGIEIKSRSKITVSDCRAMTAVAQALGKQWCGGLVVTAGSVVEKVADGDIWQIPSRRLLQPWRHS